MIGDMKWVIHDWWYEMIGDMKWVIYDRGARGVMVIHIGNGHGDTSPNHGRDQLHFT